MRIRTVYQGELERLIKSEGIICDLCAVCKVIEIVKVLKAIKIGKDRWTVSFENS